MIFQDLDAQIADAQAPIKQLEASYQQEEKEWNNKIDVAQKASQALNMSVDNLRAIGSRIERYGCCLSFAQDHTDVRTQVCTREVAQEVGSMQ